MSRANLPAGLDINVCLLNPVCGLVKYLIELSSWANESKYDDKCNYILK